MELEVPRTRDGGFKPSILPERKRITFLLDDLIRAMFIAGVSARRTGEVLKELTGSSVSASFISSSADIADGDMTQLYPFWGFLDKIRSYLSRGLRYSGVI